MGDPSGCQAGSGWTQKRQRKQKKPIQQKILSLTPPKNAIFRSIFFPLLSEFSGTLPVFLGLEPLKFHSTGSAGWKKEQLGGLGPIRPKKFPRADTSAWTKPGLRGGAWQGPGCNGQGLESQNGVVLPCTCRRRGGGRREGWVEGSRAGTFKCFVKATEQRGLPVRGLLGRAEFLGIPVRTALPSAAGDRNR